MALGFGQFNGGAVKSEVTYMKLNEGDNTFRILPNSLLPSYQYWVKGANGKELPFEALQFNRTNEKFENFRNCPIKDLGLKDPKDPSKDLRCTYAYKCLVLNKATGKVEVLTLKKGLVEEIKSVANQMGIDPTDLDTGTWFTVVRKKTGPLAFNVEYSVKQLLCKPSALTAEEKAIVAASKSIDEMFPLETYDAQLARLQKHLNGSGAAQGADNQDEEAISELG